VCQDAVEQKVKLKKDRFELEHRLRVGQPDRPFCGDAMLDLARQAVGCSTGGTLALLDSP